MSEDRSWPARFAKEVTPEDGATFADGLASKLYIGVSGDIRVRDTENNVHTFFSHPVGYFDMRCYNVEETGTTAREIRALFHG